jgi:hypothetical protein
MNEKCTLSSNVVVFPPLPYNNVSFLTVVNLDYNTMHVHNTH